MNMDNICRTCLRQPENLLPLFDGTGLPHKIETICSVQVSETDNLPSKICAECVININLSYNFRRVIINSDSELKLRILNLVNKMQVTEDLEIVQIKLETESVDLREEGFLDNGSKKDTLTEMRIGEAQQREKKYNIKLVDNIKIKENKMTNAHRKIRWTMPTPLLTFQRKRLYRCKCCDYTTSEYSKLSNHKRNHIALKSVCNICGKYVRFDNLKKHISTHTDSPVTCKECGKTFKNNESMRSHVLIHKGLAITCEFCGQIFRYRGGYRRHVLKQHTPGSHKKVKCTLCEKLFYNKTDLKKHIRSHTGERPYPCEYCKKGFSSTNALKTHIRQHTNEKPYACEFCPMAFPQKVSLRTHLKSKHSTEIENAA